MTLSLPFQYQVLQVSRLEHFGELHGILHKRLDLVVRNNMRLFHCRSASHSTHSKELPFFTIYVIRDVKSISKMELHVRSVLLVIKCQSF